MNEWLALLRVHEGGVTTMGGRLFNHGHPVAGYLAATFDALIRSEYLALGRPDPSGQQQVCVTHAGQIKYTHLTGNGAREARHGSR